MANQGYCRSCGALVLWMKTEKGKNMPVDYDADIASETEFDHTRMESHFSTCPNADSHRKGK